MSRSETAFQKVTRQLGRLREKLGVRDAKVVDNATDLLQSVGDLFYRGSTGAGDGDDPEHFHHYVIREGVLDIIAVSQRPLSAKEKAELTRRCTSPLSWSLCTGIHVDSTSWPTQSSTPVYDQHGAFIGTLLDDPAAATVAPIPDGKGGGV